MMTKVRISKKLVAIATTLVMLVAMLLPVIAAPGTPEGSITVHKFSGSTIAGAVANLTGEELSPTDLAAIAAAGYAPLEDAEFTLYQLPEVEMAAVYAAITPTNGVASHVIHLVGGFPVVTFTMADGTTHTATATAVYETQTTDTAGQAVFGNDDIPDGYYVLIETDTPTGYSTVSPSLIRLPLTRADGTANYEVHVYPKNISTAGTAVKSIDGLNEIVSNGDVVSFALKGIFNSATVSSAADLRNDIAVPMTYGIAEIQENFDATFEYVSNSMTVHWLDAFGEITGAALPTTFYTVTDTATGSPGGDLIVRLTDAGIDAAILAGAPGFGLALDAEYVGTPGVGETVTNTMSLSVVAPGASPPPPIIVEIFVPTISIVVDKRTSAEAGDLPLPGVTFAVAKVENPDIFYVPGTPHTAFNATELASLENDYVVDTTGVPITGISDAAGQIIFSNLDGYTNAGVKFYLIELETVSGYQLKSEAVEVEFDSKTGYMSLNPGWFDGSDWKENIQIIEGATIRNYELEETDPDTPGFSLPLTGGTGTLVFTAVGIIVMLGAAIVYLQGKKKNV